MNQVQDDVIQQYLDFRRTGRVDQIMDLFEDRKDIWLIDRHGNRFVGSENIAKSLGKETPNIQSGTVTKRYSNDAHVVIAHIPVRVLFATWTVKVKFTFSEQNRLISVKTLT